MYNFRELHYALVEFFKAKLPGVVVESYLKDNLPKKCPAITIYTEPVGINTSTGVSKVRKAKVTIFSHALGNIKTQESVIEAVELLDKVESLLDDFETEHNSNIAFDETTERDFDGIYNNIATCYLEFLTLYEKTNG